MQAVQRAGQDGSYRMTIDKKYSSLPTLRRIAKLLWTLWLLLVMVKTGFVAAPLQTSADSADTTFVVVLIGSAVASTGLWLLAGLGSKRERVQNVMLLNVVLVVSIAIVRSSLPPNPPSMRCLARMNIAQLYAYEYGGVVDISLLSFRGCPWLCSWF